MAVSRTGSRAGAGDASASAGSPGGTSIPLVGRVRDRLSQELNARKDRASELIESVAGTVRRVGEPLHDQSLGRLGEYTDEAASRLDRIATGLRERDVAELADDVREFGRRHPAAFAAIGFAAGMAAARFLKSTGADGGRGSRRSVAADRFVAARAGGRTSMSSTASGRVPATPEFRTPGGSEGTR